MRNRLAHASIVTKFIRDHLPTDAYLNYVETRSRGGTGLFITEPLAMTAENRVGHRLRVWDDQNLDSLKQVAELAEKHDTRIFGQVQDPGRGRHEVGRNNGAVGASALPDDLSWTVARVLSPADIERMVEAWAEGAYRIQRAGFTGVEISAGHGHLFHQFLSPWSNQREDQYGGDVAGRARLLIELIAAIRSRCGAAFGIGAKLPGDDGVANSIDLDEAARITSHVAEHASIDYWTWAWGAHANSLWRHLPDAHGERHPYLDKIRELRRASPGIAAGALGYITDPNECEKALTDGTADLVFLGRPLITDPAFGRKTATGQEATIRYCVSCNTCWRAIIEGGQLQCDNNPRVGEATEDADALAPTSSHKRVVVVGGGIAGLEAAHTAAARGHTVTLFSMSDEFGGKTRLHAELPGGENLSSIYDYQFLTAKRLGVTFEANTRASIADIRALNPDVVLLATGATMTTPLWVPEEYASEGLVPDVREIAVELLGRSGKEPGRALLVDRDHTEMTYAVAQLMADRFEHVTIVTPRERIASDVSLINRQGIYHRLMHLGVEIVTNAEPHNLDALDEDAVDVVNVWNQAPQRIDDVIALTYATARAPNHRLVPELEQAGIAYELIGDCRAPRSVLAATSEGYHAALAL